MSKFPAIPEPTRDSDDLYNTVVALKQAVETLTAQRANIDDAAVTWADLVASGLLTSNDGNGFDQLLGFLGTDTAIDQLTTDLATSLASTFAGLGTVVDVQLFTGNGTYTRAANVTKAIVIGQAPGGGGGGVGTTAGTGRGGGGGAGETRIAVVSPGATETVTVPSGGGGASAGNNSGTTASDATFGSLMTCKGGTGGGGSTGATDGTNGGTSTGSGGIRVEPVSASGVGTTTGLNKGGSSLFGTGGLFALAVGVGDGPAGEGKGGGGAGGYDTGTTARAGGAGSGGMFIAIGFR